MSTPLSNNQANSVDSRNNAGVSTGRDVGGPNAGSRSRICSLNELLSLPEGCCFVQLIKKEHSFTKGRKPFYKVIFGDNAVSFPAMIWRESPFFLECEKNWVVGRCYKIQASAVVSPYGAQLKINAIREVVPADSQDGFDLAKTRPTSRTEPETIISEILAIASSELRNDDPLLHMVQKFFKDNRTTLCDLFASRSNHHSYVGGFLEHTLSVLKIAIFLANHFLSENPLLRERFSKSLVVVGAIMHDAGQLQALTAGSQPAERTLAGDLVGHAILGAQTAYYYGRSAGVQESLLAQIEHIIVSHARFPDWGAPQAPSSLEAMVVHFADYSDACFSSSLSIISSDMSSDAFTLRKGPFDCRILKSSKIEANNSSNKIGLLIPAIPTKKNRSASSAPPALNEVQSREENPTTDKESSFTEGASLSQERRANKDVRPSNATDDS